MPNLPSTSDKVKDGKLSLIKRKQQQQQKEPIKNLVSLEAMSISPRWCANDSYIGIFARLTQRRKFRERYVDSFISSFLWKTTVSLSVCRLTKADLQKKCTFFVQSLRKKVRYALKVKTLLRLVKETVLVTSRRCCHEDDFDNL